MRSQLMQGPAKQKPLVERPSHSASAASTAPKDGLVLQPRDSLYPILIYHATPFAQLGSRWARLISSSSSSLSRFEIMEALRGDGGQRQAGNIYAVQLELGPLLLPPESEPKPESQPTTAAKEDDDRPESLFLARLIPSGVPILPETGRAVLEALGFGSGSASEAEAGKGAGAGTRAMTGAGGEGNLQDDGRRRVRPVDVEDEDDDDDAAKEGGAGGGERRSRTRTRTRTRTALAWMRAVTFLRSDGVGQAVNDGEGVTYEQASSLPPALSLSLVSSLSLLRLLVLRL